MGSGAMADAKPYDEKQTGSAAQRSMPFVLPAAQHSPAGTLPALAARPHRSHGPAATTPSHSLAAPSRAFSSARES